MILSSFVLPLIVEFFSTVLKKILFVLTVLNLILFYCHMINDLHLINTFIHTFVINLIGNVLV